MKLTENERSELLRQANARNVRADSARHARLILLVASGQREQADAFYAQTLLDLPQARQNAKFRALLDTPAPTQ